MKLRRAFEGQKDGDFGRFRAISGLKLWRQTSPGLQKKVGEVISRLAEYVCAPDDPRGSLAPGHPSGWRGARWRSKARTHLNSSKFHEIPNVFRLFSSTSWVQDVEESFA